MIIANKININNVAHFESNFQKYLQFIMFYEKLQKNLIFDATERKMYIKIKNKFKTHIIQIINVIITTMFNFDDAIFYATYESKFMIVDKTTKTIESNMWNFFENYFRTFLILIKNEIQLRSIILSDKNINDFVNFLRMSLFQRLKMLNQSSVLLNVQYRMIKTIDFMISKLFYFNMITNNSKTKISNRALTQKLI